MKLNRGHHIIIRCQACHEEIATRGDMADEVREDGCPTCGARRSRLAVVGDAARQIEHAAEDNGGEWAGWFHNGLRSRWVALAI